jgi:prepilin-type N-terminal cleavage/methylation domain-containing protein
MKNFGCRVSEKKREKKRFLLVSRFKTMREGFTLMEMMIVVSIIAILSSVAVTSYRSNINKIKAHNSARTIVLTMSEARIRAISENNYYIVAFRKPGDIGFAGNAIAEYIVEVLDDNDNSTDYNAGEKITTEELRPGIIYNFPIGDDFKCLGTAITGINDGINFPNNEVVFYPRGNSSVDGEVYIIPDNDVVDGLNSNRRCIYLMNITGKSVIYKYDQAESDGGNCPWTKE